MTSSHIGPPVVLNVAELATRVGQPLGRSSWRRITQDEVDIFAGLTGDEQWIHIDPERARVGPFGATIAHGYFTLSLATQFLDEVLVVEGAGLVLNYGSERVRYPAPVPVGSRVRALIELPAVTEISGGVQTTFRLTFEIEGAKKPGCVADIVYRYYDVFPGATAPADAVA
ncbi:MAG: MaoC family dehydratase [Acidimicrobiales bacterium]